MAMSAAAAAPAAAAVAASFPSVKHKQDLQVHKLKALSLFTVPNLLSPYECDAFINYAEGLGFSHQGSLGPAKGEAFRDNDRVSLQNSALAESLWSSGLSRIFHDIKSEGRSAIGLNPNIRFYRYKEGQRFGQHIDESVYLDGRCRTRYTLLVYLNGAMKTSKKNNLNDESAMVRHLQGGETVFYTGRRSDSIEVSPVAGMALLHLHGEKCMLHEARVVSKGVKYVLRSDVIFN